MKFGKQLEKVASEGTAYAEYHINYKAMKRCLKTAAADKNEISPVVSSFRQKQKALKELEDMLLADLRRATTAIEDALGSAGARSESADSRAESLRAADDFVQLNKTAVYKITKKMFKKLDFRPMALSILYPDVSTELQAQAEIVARARSGRAATTHPDPSRSDGGTDDALNRTTTRSPVQQAATLEIVEATPVAADSLRRRGPIVGAVLRVVAFFQATASTAPAETTEIAVWLRDAAMQEAERAALETAAAASAPAPAEAASSDPEAAAVDAEEVVVAEDDLEAAVPGDSVHSGRSSASSASTAAGEGGGGGGGGGDNRVGQRLNNACAAVFAPCACLSFNAPPLFFVGHVAALTACAVVQSTSPAPVTWILLTVIGVSQALSLPHQPTATMYRRSIMYCAAFFVLAEGVVAATALRSYLTAVNQYDTWCVVDGSEEAWAAHYAATRDGEDGGQWVIPHGTASGASMCDGLLFAWLLMATCSLIGVLLFTATLLFTIKSPNKHNSARTLVLRSLAFLIIHSVLLHVTTWTIIIIFSRLKQPPQADEKPFSPWMYLIAVFLGAPNRELTPLGVPYINF